MRRLLFALLAGGAVWGGAAAPPAAQTTVEAGDGAFTALPAGALTRVSVLDAEGGTLRAGPLLVEVGPGGAFRLVGDDPAFDPPTAFDARAFAVEAEGDTVVVALGYSDLNSDEQSPPLAAAGFAVSTDGGRTWTARGPALDESDDTAVTVGASVLRAVPATVPQDAATVDLALTAGGDTVYAASGRAGLRRSTDLGATWRPVVLPPDTAFVLDPRAPQSFVYAPDPRRLSGDEAEAVGSQLNNVALSVLVDEAGTVWAGTFGGLNRSVRLPGVDDLAWIRYVDDPLGGGPLANGVAVIEARPDPDGRDDVWVAAVPSVSPLTPDPALVSEQEAGISVWRGDDADGFAVFETVLLGVVVNDFAFDAERAYAAALGAGLYVSDDDGATWRAVRAFRDAAGRRLPLGDDPSVLAVATTPGAVWAGTSGGLLQSTDGAQTWTLFRASVAPGAGFDGREPAEPGSARDVDVYAYPNPFAPRDDGAVRVRLDLDAPADLTVRVFDFAMNLVRTLDAPGRPAGPNEVRWDGRTDGGLRVANGAYIYVVEGAGAARSGRVLVVE